MTNVQLYISMSTLSICFVFKGVEFFVVTNKIMFFAVHQTGSAVPKLNLFLFLPDGLHKFYSNFICLRVNTDYQAWVPFLFTMPYYHIVLEVLMYAHHYGHVPKGHNVQDCPDHLA